jgi:hypothetical protein
MQNYILCNIQQEKEHKEDYFDFYEKLLRHINHPFSTKTLDNNGICSPI